MRCLSAALLMAMLATSAGCASSKVRVLPPQPLRGNWHVVVAGETLDLLARRYGVAVIDLEELNDLDSSTTLVAGRKIFIPRKPPSRRRPVAKRLRRSRPPHGKRDKTKRVTASQAKLAWPVQNGKLSSRFGLRKGRIHEGVDIAAPEGTAVLAAAGGRVIYAGAGIRGYGNMIIVRHEGKLVTVYAHNRRNLVQQGTEVHQGQVIGEVGHTGRTSGDHLHFEVRIGESPQDPLKYLPEL